MSAWYVMDCIQGDEIVLSIHTSYADAIMAMELLWNQNQSRTTLSVWNKSGMVAWYSDTGTLRRVPAWRMGA